MQRNEYSTHAADHHRVYKARGAAKQYPCAFCGGPAKEWSCIHDTDPKDVNNYRPACIPCHVGYDRHAPKGECKYGHDVALWGRRRGTGVCSVCFRLNANKSRTVCWHCAYRPCRCKIKGFRNWTKYSASYKWKP